MKPLNKFYQDVKFTAYRLDGAAEWQSEQKQYCNRMIQRAVRLKQSNYNVK